MDFCYNNIMKISKENLKILFQDPSVVSLIIANSVTLFGVIFFGWNLFLIMIIFWLESAIIGFYNILKMFIVGKLFSIPLILFFTIHYGGFMFGHFIFIVALFGQGAIQDGKLNGEMITNEMILNLLLAILCLFVSHGISFYYNFIKQKEYSKTNLTELIFQPYSRIIIMHLTLMLCAFSFVLLGSPIVASIVAIIVKTYVDLLAHLKTHKKLLFTK